MQWRSEDYRIFKIEKQHYFTIRTQKLIIPTEIHWEVGTDKH